MEYTLCTIEYFIQKNLHYRINPIASQHVRYLARSN